jgi:hypothetical protein
MLVSVCSYCKTHYVLWDWKDLRISKPAKKVKIVSNHLNEVRYEKNLKFPVRK